MSDADTAPPFSGSRRATLAQAVAAVIAASLPRSASPAEQAEPAFRPERRWYEAAASMERLARSWGDQPYGAVLVFGDIVIGEGPSRVIKLGDPLAHAEREAIRDAQRRLGRNVLAGSVLYSTSRHVAFARRRRPRRVWRGWSMARS